MAYDELLASRIRAVLGEDDEVVEKRMFGGLVFMSKGPIRTVLSPITQSPELRASQPPFTPLPEFARTLAFYKREGFSVTGGRKLKARF